MLFTLICTDKPGGLATRQATRPAHLDYLRGHESALQFAGPMLDPEGNPCGSLFVIDVADRAAAEALAANDPYAKAGLFESTVIRPIRQVARDGKLASQMAYWLVKSEPDAFSWAQQVAAGVEPWTGVRNALARRHLAAMRRGDQALFYHSNSHRAGGRVCVGLVEVARESYPDPTDETGRWVCVDMRALAPLPRPVALAQLKADPLFADLALLRQSRLSVSPVSEPHWRRILEMGGL